MKWTKWKCGDLMMMGITFEYPDYRISGPVIVLQVEAKPWQDANQSWIRRIQVWDPTEEMKYDVIEVRDAPGREGMANTPGHYRQLRPKDPNKWPARYKWPDES